MISHRVRAVTPRNNWAAVKKRAGSIVDLYNAHYRTNEKLELKHPDRVTVLSVCGDAGGVIIDEFHYWSDGVDCSFSFVIFAAFEPSNRNQGRLKACMIEAQKRGIDVTAVEVDTLDGHDAWHALGYTVLGCLDFRVFLSKTPLTGATSITTGKK